MLPRRRQSATTGATLRGGLSLNPSIDLDLLPADIVTGARFGIVDAADPEVDDRTEAEELLAARVAEVPARLGGHDPVHHPPAPFPHARLALEAGQPFLELGQPELRARFRHPGRGNARLRP